MRVIAAAIGATLSQDDEGARLVHDVQTLQGATTNDLSFFENPKYGEQLRGHIGRGLPPD